MKKDPYLSHILKVSSQEEAVKTLYEEQKTNTSERSLNQPTLSYPHNWPTTACGGCDSLKNSKRVKLNY